MLMKKILSYSRLYHDLTASTRQSLMSLRINVLFVLAWVICLRGWHGWRACVGSVGGVLAWVAC